MSHSTIAIINRIWFKVQYSQSNHFLGPTSRSFVHPKSLPQWKLEFPCHLGVELPIVTANQNKNMDQPKDIAEAMSRMGRKIDKSHAKLKAVGLSYIQDSKPTFKEYVAKVRSERKALGCMLGRYNDPVKSFEQFTSLPQYKHLWRGVLIVAGILMPELGVSERVFIWSTVEHMLPMFMNHCMFAFDFYDPRIPDELIENLMLMGVERELASEDDYLSSYFEAYSLFDALNGRYKQLAVKNDDESRRLLPLFRRRLAKYHAIIGKYRQLASI